MVGALGAKRHVAVPILEQTFQVLLLFWIPIHVLPKENIRLRGMGSFLDGRLRTSPEYEASIDSRLSFSRAPAREMIDGDEDGDDNGDSDTLDSLGQNSGMSLHIDES